MIKGDYTRSIFPRL